MPEDGMEMVLAIHTGPLPVMLQFIYLNGGTPSKREKNDSEGFGCVRLQGTHLRVLSVSFVNLRTQQIS